MGHLTDSALEMKGERSVGVGIPVYGDRGLVRSILDWTSVKPKVYAESLDMEPIQKPYGIHMYTKTVGIESLVLAHQLRPEAVSLRCLRPGAGAELVNAAD